MYTICSQFAICSFSRLWALSPNLELFRYPASRETKARTWHLVLSVRRWFHQITLAARYRSASAACGVRSELGLALAGFALGYGTREVVSYRRRQAARERYRELGLVD